MANTDLRSHRRSDRRARCDLQALQLEIPFDLLGPDADGVNRHAVRGTLRQALFAQRAAVLRAIAEQDDAR